MRNLVMVLFFTACFTACSSSKKLYTWHNYDITSYNYLKNTDEKSIEELKKTYIKIIEEQKGTRNAVPPGIYADYGFLLIQEGMVEEGVELIKQEMKFYPESKIFLELILEMVDQ